MAKMLAWSSLLKGSPEGVRNGYSRVVTREILHVG